MRIDNNFIFCLFIVGLFLLSACSPTRRLAPGQQLFEGATVEFVKPDLPPKKKVLKEEMIALVRPGSNSPFKLWVYNLVKPPKKQKGFKYWLKYKVGEPPVLFDNKIANRNKLVLLKYLRDNGYLNATVEMDTISKPKKVKVIYSAKINKLYRLNNIFLPDGTSVLDTLTRENQQQSFLKKNQVYKAEKLKSERVRLAVLATQNGYYGVNENDLFFYIDTTNYIDSLDLYVRWKPKVDSSSLKKYFLGATTLFPDYTLIDSMTNLSDTIQLDNVKLIVRENYFKSSLFARAIRGKQGEVYDGRLQASTLNYLQDLDVFKYINLKNEKRSEGGKNYLDQTYYLTPSSFRTARIDFESNTRSGSYFGILAAANYTNKNWLGGAERLDLNISLGGETQLGNTTQFINTLELTTGASLAVPGLILPFFSPKKYNDYVARTRFTLSNGYQIRTGFFNINRLTAQMTYDWRTTSKLRNQWTPILISQSQTFNITSEFQEQLDDNLRLSNSLENVFILGGQYHWTYSNQEINKKKPYVFLSGIFKSAGNIPHAVASVLSNKEEPYKIGTIPFSQFLKLSLDARYYRPRKRYTTAFRIAAGVVKSYGNASVAPYSEQFFVGGSNSIRAFRLRELGPGAYVNPTVSQVDFFDQTGDVKLELNVEYRFDIAAYFKGAFFVDAGNIWLLNETIGDDEEGQFDINTFYDEIAVGTGLGFRIDFDYFVIRLDGAFPIRKPIADAGFQWTFNQLNFLNKDWRSENVVFHLAIGYPF